MQQKWKPALVVFPWDMFVSLVANRVLIGRLVRREIDAKFRGSILGSAWYFVLPLFLMTIYTFVFGVVFKVRWPQQASADPAAIGLYLFSGLLIFTILSEILGRAPTLVLENVSYVKRVVFPLEVLPWIALASALATFCISAVVFIVIYMVLLGPPPATILLTPLLLIPLSMVALGLAWFLASLGVFLRDLRYVISVVITGLPFGAPIFYPMTAVPDEYAKYLRLNPVTIPIELSKSLIFDGRIPNLQPLIGYTTAALLVFWIGFWWFMRTKKAFADVV
jgi:lipopolysaccharide transport system permease protein